MASENMTFETALTTLQTGVEILRTGWKDQFLHFVNPEIGILVVRKFPNGTVQVNPWAAISGDMLATDWATR